jgi:CHAT domain-containing protein
MAGANRRQEAGPDEDDGILTADEISMLDLRGTQWAVLSACDTGLGEVRVGEGVFGLRRAFQLAGAHTVIMSLWPVEDEAARAWMASLYRYRCDASLEALRQRRARGLSTHPLYWAGFIAAGDWR